MTPEMDRYHAQRLQKLSDAGDWAGSVRHFMAFYEPALATARTILTRRAKEGGNQAVLWEEVLGILDRFVRELIHPEDVERLFHRLASPEEKVTLLLLGLWQFGSMCALLSERRGSPKTLDTVLEPLCAAEAGAQLCREIKDEALTAVFLNFASAGHHARGALAEALPRLQEASGIYRRLVAQHPDVFEPELAVSLNNIGNCLAELGRREEALTQAGEAAELFRKLAVRNPCAYEPNLAGSLTNLAHHLIELGRREDALALAQEAVEICRKLTGQNADAYELELATSLNNVAKSLNSLGRREEALGSALEAVEIYRKLAYEHPHTFEPNLAMSLNNVSLHLVEVGRFADALSPVQEASELYRKLAGWNPDVFGCDLAGSLVNLASRLRAVGRIEEALVPVQEAVEICRSLVRRNAEAFEYGLVLSLNVLSNVLNDLRRHNEALAPAQEASEICRGLTRRNAAAFAHILGISLGNLSGRLSQLGRREESIATAQEAVEIHRELAGRNPDSFEPYLARSLDCLALRLGELSRREDSLAPCYEAVEIRRRLAARNPDAFDAELAVSLMNLAMHLVGVGEREGALVAAQEASELYDKCSSGLANVEFRLRAHANLGRLVREQSCAQNRPDYRRAFVAFQTAVSCAEQFRGGFRDETQRQRILRETFHAYAGLVQTGIDLWDTEQDLEALQTALHTAESARSRRLLDLLAHEAFEPRAPEALRKAFQKVHEELQRARLRLREPESGGENNVPLPDSDLMAVRSQTRQSPFARPKHGGETALVAAVEEVKRLESEETRILAEIKPHDPDFNPNQPVPTVAEKEVRRLAEDGSETTLVEYFVGVDEGYAFLLAPGKPLSAVRLPGLGRNAVLELARQWFEGYAPANRPAFETWSATMPARLEEIARLAVWPVLEALSPKSQIANRKSEISRIVLCPHEFLHVFPLHACPLPGGGVVADRFEVTYTPSLSLLHRVAGRKRERKNSSLLVGNPTLDLTFTALESALFTGRYRGAARLYGHTATPEAFLKEAEDKALRLGTIYARLKLSEGWLVILNGCESGLLLPGADGTMDFEGLPMAFLFAGAINVISALWTVYDISSALLMDRFHHELAQPGATVSAALRAAADWLRGASPDGIRDGQKLMLEVGAMLGRLERREYEELSGRKFEALKAECERQARRHAEKHTQDAPFAEPVYWAAHIASGHCWKRTVEG